MFQLRIANCQHLRTKIFTALINVHSRVVRAKTIIRILGLMGWLVAPKKGHVPFLVGIWTTLSQNRSEFIRVMGNFWRSLVSIAMVAMPDFAPPRVVASTWMCVKWIGVDADECIFAAGDVRYRVGL